MILPCDIIATELSCPPQLIPIMTDFMKKLDNSINLVDNNTDLDAVPFTNKEFEQEDKESASSGEEKDIILPDLSLLEIDEIDDSYPFC